MFAILKVSIKSPMRVVKEKQIRRNLLSVIFISDHGTGKKKKIFNRVPFGGK